jgi:hypothetical protein
MSIVLEAAPAEARRAAPPPPPTETPSLLDRYRTGYQRRVAAHVDQRLRALREMRALQGLEPEQHTRVLVGMRRLQCQLAGTVVQKQDAMAALLRISLVALVFCYAVFVPLTVRRLLVEVHGVHVDERPYLLHIAVLLAGAGTLVLLARRGRRRWGSTVGGRRLTGGVAAFCYVAWFLAVTVVDRTDFSAHGALQALGLMLLYGLGFVVLGALALWWGMHITEQWWDHRAYARHPDAVVADELLRILETVEKSPAEWVHMRGRRKVVRSLEVAARCLEHNLPSRLNGEDAATDHWLRKRAAGQAAALRGLKRWVLVPRPDTREHFVGRVAQDLVRTTVGDWDGLECTEAETVPVSRGRRLARRLAIPLAATAVVLALAIAPSEPVRDVLGRLAPFSAVLISVLGPTLMVIIMRFVDPELLDDLPILQQVAAFFGKKS